jgi:hypothetical protein
MPRKQKPKFDPQSVHPARIVDLAALSYDSEGYRHVTLLLPGVPPNQVEAIGHACARAILGVLEWPDDKAAELAERVRKHLADEWQTASNGTTRPVQMTGWPPPSAAMAR